MLAGKGQAYGAHKKPAGKKQNGNGHSVPFGTRTRICARIARMVRKWVCARLEWGTSAVSATIQSDAVVFSSI